jgi:hypothetical protein
VKTISILLLCLTFNQAHADVYADPKEPNVTQFIKISVSKDTYAFKLCDLADVNECQTMGSQAVYSKADLEARIKTLKEKGKAASVFGLVTGGLSLLGTAEYYLRRRAIDPKVLKVKKVLEYKVDEKGTATGTLGFYLSRLEKALNEKPTL